jgi:hypothetical protein
VNWKKIFLANAEIAMEPSKAVKEGLNLAETDELTPQDLINSNPVSAAS